MVYMWVINTFIPSELCGNFWGRMRQQSNGLIHWPPPSTPTSPHPIFHWSHLIEPISWSLHPLILQWTLPPSHSHLLLHNVAGWMLTSTASYSSAWKGQGSSNGELNCYLIETVLAVPIQLHTLTIKTSIQHWIKCWFLKKKTHTHTQCAHRKQAGVEMRIHLWNQRPLATFCGKQSCCSDSSGK